MKAPPAGPRARHVAQTARFKLIPTKGMGPIRFVYERQVAMSEAERQFKETGVPVMVVAYPEDHMSIHTVAVVGGKKKGKR